MTGDKTRSGADQHDEPESQRWNEEARCNVARSRGRPSRRHRDTGSAHFWGGGRRGLQTDRMRARKRRSGRREWEKAGERVGESDQTLCARVGACKRGRSR